MTTALKISSKTELAEKAKVTAKIAELNDKVRSRMSPNWIFTNLVRSLDGDKLNQLIQLVKQFNQFDQDNDPYGEHDFGMIPLDGTTYYWKISYYDKASWKKGQEYGSESPEDENVTHRIITIMECSEY